MTADPLALAVLRQLATRGTDDPLGSLAHRVLSGEASLREAATWSWHSEAMTSAFAAAQREQDRMPAYERAVYEQQARRLRYAEPVTPEPE